MKFHIRLLVTIASVLAMTFILPGICPESFMSAMGASALLALMITGTKRLFLKLRVPMNMIYFGFFLFIMIFSLTMIISAAYPGFSVKNGWYALLFSIVLTGITSVINSSIVPADSQN